MDVLIRAQMIENHREIHGNERSVSRIGSEISYLPVSC